MFFIDKKQLAKSIKDMRQNKNLSQQELGILIGTSQPNIARIERGDNLPTLDTLDKLCFHLGFKLNLSIEKLQ